MAADKILIIDDNPINLKLVKLILFKNGYEVFTASDAENALKLLENLRPRLILMDIQLPGIDGLQLTKKLKSDPKYKNTIIVAVTAYAMKGDERKALLAGCNGYISKPINVHTFPDTIADYLAKA